MACNHEPKDLHITVESEQALRVCHQSCSTDVLLSSIVILCRLWFDKRVSMRFPANVLSGFDDTMGSTFFDLNDLQVSY